MLLLKPNVSMAMNKETFYKKNSERFAQFNEEF